MPGLQSISVDVTWTVILAAIVLYVGRWLTSQVRLLREFNIPESVSGGLVCSAVVAAIFLATNNQISFDLSLRDTLLLVFFCTIGLSAKLRTLVSGGKSLAILVVCAVGFLVLQDIAGICVAFVLGANPAYGLIAGGRIGGPIANRLIARNDLSGDTARQEYVPGPEVTEASGPVASPLFRNPPS